MAQDKRVEKGKEGVQSTVQKVLCYKERSKIMKGTTLVLTIVLILLSATYVSAAIGRYENRDFQFNIEPYYPYSFRPGEAVWVPDLDKQGYTVVVTPNYQRPDALEADAVEVTLTYRTHTGETMVRTQISNVRRVGSYLLNFHIGSDSTPVGVSARLLFWESRPASVEVRLE